MEIVTYPNSILTTPTLDVVKITYKHVELALRMHEKQKELGAVGLAANQVGSNKSIAVVQPTKSSPVLFLINPKITAYSGALIDSYEGCVSIPDRMFTVKRFPEIEVRFFDLSGHMQRLDLKGFEAVIVQHEIDHLKGLTLFDREKRYDRLNRRNAEEIISTRQAVHP